MLTSDLVRVTVRSGRVYPRYIDTGDPAHRSLAEQLIEIFRLHVGHSRHELEAELADLLGTGTAFLLHRGLAKLLDDRCELDTEAPADPGTLRQAVFGAAARAYREPTQGEAPAQFTFDREAVLATAAAELELPAEAVEGGLYADLKSEQVLKSFKPCKPDWLLARYNVALAQAVLFKATELTIELAPGASPQRYRALFRKVKFFQLLHRVEGDARRGFRLHLDGPLSLFSSSQRYGLKMATFLPTLLHFDGWRLTAELAWGKKRQRRTFELTPEAGLEPHTRLTGQWQPEEVAWLPEQMAKLDCGWTVETGGELVELGGQGVLVPDFVFEHESGKRVVMEVLGFWRKGAVESRLELLRRHGPDNLILALSKQLATGRDDLDELPGEVHLFRRQPIARQVLKVLERMRGAGDDG
jgi:hypothetical protein